MDKRSLQFPELTMAVIVGVLLSQTAAVAVENPSFTNARLIVLILAILIFLEIYVVLVRYHEQIGVPYVQAYLFPDVFICFIFVVFVELIRVDKVPGAMLVIAGLFLILAMRQWFTYRQAAALDASLEKLGIQKKDLVLPILADFVSIPVCLAIYAASTNGDSFVGLSTAAWSWLGIVLFAAYFLSVYIFKFELKTRR